MQKKGQGGVEISILIILIALFILLYVILLPPAERAELLNETTEETAALEAIPAGAKVLLSESPGNVFTYSKNVYTAKLEPMHLYSKENTATFNLVKSLVVSRNLLKDNFRDIIFNIDDLESLKNVKLFMVIAESKGRLTIKLNNNIIYQGFLTTEQLPIELPKDYLRKSNKLEFSVALPGWSEFYSSNYYILQDISLIKVYAVKNTEASRGFFIDVDEGEKIKKATLYYIINCNTLEPKGTLTILLNNMLASKDTIFCEYREEIALPLSKDMLSNDGRNRLVFKIDNGDYNIDQPRVTYELGKSIFPKYSFDIDTTLYNEVKNRQKKILLKMTFGDTGRKKASISVQDSEFSFDTTAKEYSKDISNFIEDGANYIKIVPKENFEITSLKVIAQPA